MSVFKKRGSKGDLTQEYPCTIRFLDDSEPMQIVYKKDTIGQWMIDQVCIKLNLVEKDYFGLRYVDMEKQRHWLDPLKTVHRQMKGITPLVLCFRVKFYPDAPEKLHEEMTRYFLFLQLRRDLQHGRLLCTPNDANELAAYIIQSEVGDYDTADHAPGYISEYKMLPKQNAKMEEKINEIHKTLDGQVPGDAEAKFLSKAASLDTYGVDPHQVRDQKGNQLYLGVTHQGIITFQGNRKTHQFSWDQIKRIAYEGKLFIVHVTVSENDQPPPSPGPKKKQHAVGFKCPTSPACKYLWKCAVEQQFFFTLSTSTNPPRIRSGSGIFMRGSKFRFSGRCLSEAYAASNAIKRDEPGFARSASQPNIGRRLSGKSALQNQSLPIPLIKEETAVDVPNATTEADVIRPSTVELTKAEKRQSGDENKILTMAESPVATVQSGTSPLHTSLNSTIPDYRPEDSLDDSRKDLDKQIEELEKQFDMIRNEPANHVTSTPNPKAKQNNVGPKPGGGGEAKKSSNVVFRLFKFLLYVVIFVCIMFWVSLFLATYFEVKHPYVDIAWEQVGHVKAYGQGVNEKVMSLFNKS